MHITRYPSRQLQAQITQCQWDAALDAWIRCLRHFLMASEVAFQLLLTDPENASLYTFIQDYLEVHTPRQNPDFQSSLESPSDDELSKSVFLLLYRIFSSERPCLLIFDIPFVLFDFCALFALQSTESVLLVFENLCKNAEKQVFLQTRHVREQFQAFMDMLVSTSDDMILKDILSHRISLQSLTLFIRICFPATCVFLEDEDFLRSIVYVYHRDVAVDQMKPDLLRLIYTLFTSFLMRNQACLLIIKGFTWLYEQLSLETALLRDLVLDTSIVERFYEIELFSEEIMSQLRILKQNYGTNVVEKETDFDIDSSVSQLSMISHIKDLFPEYGEGFIEICLKEFDNNVETTISHILEDSFPPHIRLLDKKLPRTTGKLSKEVPKTIINKENDLNSYMDFSKIYKGKKNYQTVDIMLQDKSFIREHKQTILDLVALNQDDERDDTYDDVDGSNLEFQNETGSSKLMTNMDEVLYATYLVSPEVFIRSSQTRRSPARIELRLKTGLSDEQIEGWKIMLDRNPHQLEKFEEMFKVTENQTVSVKSNNDSIEKINNNFQSLFLNKKSKEKKDIRINKIQKS